LAQTLIKNWWLLALCGVFDAIISFIYLGKLSTGFVSFAAVAFVGKLTVAAGVCAIAGGVWRSAQGKCWPLVLHGLALVAMGLIFSGVFGTKTKFLTIALLIMLAAISIGILAITAARTLRRERHVMNAWLLDVVGAASVGFALAFYVLGFQWIKLGPGSHTDLIWLGAYFGFSAVCMLGAALRLRSLSLSSPIGTLPLGRPGHAHP